MNELTDSSEGEHRAHAQAVLLRQLTRVVADELPPEQPAARDEAIRRAAVVGPGVQQGPASAMCPGLVAQAARSGARP